MPESGNRIAWVGVDWGTTNARAYGFDDEDRFVEEAPHGPGMTSLTPDGFEPALRDMIGPWMTSPGLDVIICGMAGARQGWCEAPYTIVPGELGGEMHAVRPPVTGDALNVAILPGLSTGNAVPDVMRGEETQMIGFLQRHPAFKGQICMPGTHSKWARVKRQRIESFRTYMTGEMFDLLSNQSVLRHSVDTGWNADAFRTAFLQTYRAPADLTRLLFGVRAGDLLHGWPAGAGRAHLSGLLIGAEFANEAIEGETVGLIGTGSLTQIYRAAMALAGIRPVTLDSAEAVRSGLVAARRALTSET